MIIYATIGFQGIYNVSDISEMKRDLLNRMHSAVIFHFMSIMKRPRITEDIQLVCGYVFNFSEFDYVTKKPLPDVQVVLCFSARWALKCSLARLPSLRHRTHANFFRYLP